MGCFEKLVKSNFLANVLSELSLARRTLKSMSQTNFPASILANNQDKKALYEEVVYQYYLLEAVAESLEEMGDSKSLLFYINIDHGIFVYSRTKSQIDEAIRYAYNVSGDFPFYRGRHKIKNNIVHTVMFDTRITFNPISPN